MKRLLFFLALTVTGYVVNAQSTQIVERPQVRTVTMFENDGELIIHHMPMADNWTYRGDVFYQSNLPDTIKRAVGADVNGTLSLKCLVTKEGAIGECEIIQSLNTEVDARVIKTIKGTSNWQPQSNKFKFQDSWVKMNIPIR